MNCDFFPVWHRAFLKLFLLAVIAAVLAVVVLFVDIVQVNETSVFITSSAVAVASVLFTFFQIYLRHRVRSTVFHIASLILRDGHTCHIAFRTHPKLTSRVFKIFGLLFSNQDLRMTIMSSERTLKIAAPHVDASKLDPYIFVSFEPQTTVAPWGSRSVMFRGLRGIPDHRWCEVEWMEDEDLNTRSAVHRCIEHELEHAMLQAAYPLWDGEMHHRVMEFARKGPSIGNRGDDTPCFR